MVLPLRRKRASALATFLMAAAASLAVACAPGTHAVSTAVGAERIGADVRAPAGAITDHVVIVSVDGLRPDAIVRYKAATIGRLVREGSHTFAATTIMPSKTLPSHTSMLTGEGPDEHAITWNSNQTDKHATVAIPTIFGLARSRGFHTAAFFSKGKFRHLDVPGTLDYAQAPRGNDRWSADRTMDGVERYLAARRPSLLFVHLGEPDYAGHVWGWMSWAYGRAVRAADLAVGRLVAAADRAYGVGNYTLILTSDHGGHGRKHGSDRAEDVTIPWIAWGKGVEPGGTVRDGVRTMDTAGTALWLLGLGAPHGWSGVPVRAAFTTGAQAAADAAISAGAASAPTLDGSPRN